MADDGVQRALETIEDQLKKGGRPVKARLLFKDIREEFSNIRDIDLREAVWILIGRGKITLTPNRELN